MIAQSSDETFEAGKAFGKGLPKKAVVAFFGDLGAGKTTFIRGLTEGIGAIDPRCVCSPTFALLNVYEGNKKIYHFDLYRLPRTEEFLAAGFDEYFDRDGICCIEWAEKIEPLLPKDALRVTLSHAGVDTRCIEIAGPA